MNATIKKLGYEPDAIMINVPNAFFKHDGKIKGDREEAFRRYYESMGNLPGLDDDACFYHFISTVPTIEVQFVYVCFRGFVQYKALLVKFMKNEPVMLATYQHPMPRNWCVTTGPVIKAPAELQQKGLEGSGIPASYSSPRLAYIEVSALTERFCNIQKRSLCVPTARDHSAAPGSSATQLQKHSLFCISAQPVAFLAGLCGPSPFYQLSEAFNTVFFCNSVTKA